jgi:hypothetical protein
MGSQQTDMGALPFSVPKDQELPEEHRKLVSEIRLTCGLIPGFMVIGNGDDDQNWIFQKNLLARFSYLGREKVLSTFRRVGAEVRDNREINWQQKKLMPHLWAAFEKVKAEHTAAAGSSREPQS